MFKMQLKSFEYFVIFSIFQSDEVGDESAFSFYL